MGGMDATMVAMLGALVAAGVTLLLYASFASAGEVKRLKGRVSRIRGRWGLQSPEEKIASVRLNDAGKLAWLERYIHPLIPRPAQLRERLSKTGRNISPGSYAIACVATGVVASIVRMMVLDFPPLIALMFGVVAGVGLPHFYIGHMIKRRIKKFGQQFPEAIELIIRGLKSGLPVSESIRTVGEEFDGPVGDEFGLIADRLKVGQTLEEAMWDAVKRIDIAEFKFFVISLAVQKETGGNLTETLENLAEILRRRRQMVLKVRAMSSEAKASAMILGSLPFVMFGLMSLVGGGYTMVLFTDPRGHMLLGIGAGFLLTGVLVMAKMVKFEI